MNPTEQNSAPRVLPQRQVERAFTLIELLVVIAIVAVLATVVLTSGKSVLRSGASVRAMSNLKQTSVMMMNYAAENNRFPPSADWGAIMFGGGAVFFQRTLNDFGGFPWRMDRPNTPLSDVFYDPALKGKRQHPWGGFAVNTSIILNTWDCRRFGSEEGIPVTVIPNPAAKVVYCSAKEPGWDSTWLFSGDNFAQQGWQTNNGPEARHNGLATGLFADGHVENLDVKNMDPATRSRLFTLDQ